MSKLYGPISSVLVDEIPPRRVGKWHELIDELRLRMEQTGPRESLKVPVPDRKSADSAIAAIRKQLSLRAESRETGGDVFVYVWNEEAKIRIGGRHKK